MDLKETKGESVVLNHIEDLLRKEVFKKRYSRNKRDL